MDLSPQAVAAATFDTARKGYDTEEVRTFLARVAAQLEASQQQAAAMEARARAAIAKMQELQQASANATSDPTPPGATTDEAAVISRTLLLAQRTADATVAEARADADRMLAEARAEATSTLESARATAASLVEEAKAEARQAKESELVAAEGEVQALLARRDFLLGDVEILDEHLAAQRERVRETIAALEELVERVPAGLGEMRMPLLSASADDTLESIGADATAHDAPQDAAEDSTHDTVRDASPDATPDTTPDGVVRIGAEERR